MNYCSMSPIFFSLVILSYFLQYLEVSIILRGTVYSETAVDLISLDRYFYIVDIKPVIVKFKLP